MEKKLDIIQFMPYFPPHKGGVEIVGEEIGIYWRKSGFGNVINVVTDFEQALKLSLPKGEEKMEYVLFEGEVIGYRKNGVINLVVPSWEIVNNFPCYRLFNKKKNLVFKYLENYVRENSFLVVITHTRFFLTSLVGGLFARKNKVKWVHIEHGSDYVKLSSKLKSGVAYVYDKIIGKWIFRKADKVLAISEASKEFVERVLSESGKRNN